MNKYTDKLSTLVAWLWIITLIAFSLGACTWTIQWLMRLWGVM